MLYRSKKSRSSFRYVADAIAAGIFVGACLVWQFSWSSPQAEFSPIIDARRVTFLAVGDIMLSRGVARAIDRSGNPELPFSEMEGVFRTTDFNFGNLENPISGNDAIAGKGLRFNMRRSDVAGLKANNFKVLNLANNHALDQGVTGLRRTTEFLKSQGITTLGVGDDLAAAWRPKTITVKGVTIGFVGASYASDNNGGDGRNPYVARIEDGEYLSRAIDELRADGVDFIIATMHAGTEYRRRPNDAQVAFARQAIDLGADMVIGAHPHWPQTFEEYRGRYIFYSLGNFIFDQKWSIDTREGLALRITLKMQKKPFFGTRVEEIEFLPVIIDNASTPRLADEAESRRILNKIGAADRVFKP